MAFVCQLIEGVLDPINLFYSADDGWAMLEKGLMPNDPERRELWGGYLEDQLVRQEDGKRVLPLKLQGKWTTPDELIDAVNALEERLRHAARFRKDGWGDEIFLHWQLHTATFPVRFPVCSGSIDKQDLMNACASIMESGHRVTKALPEVGVTLVCENYWEADTTYMLENYIDNPGFWRGAAPGDSWTEVNGGDVTSTIDTTIYEVMGQSLKQVYVVDAVNDTGVISDAQAVVASTAYYFEARNYRAAACDVLTAQIYDISNGAVIAASALTFNGATGAWIKQGVTFNTPVGCISVRVELLCLAASSAAGGTAYWDAVYLDDGTTAPAGWISGRDLTNHLDADADHLNVLCVTEIPGEVEAETKITLDLDDDTDGFRLANRTRDDPSEFIWHLVPCGAYTTAEGGAGGACTPGLTNAACKDSDKIIDATAPSGSRIAVTFAGTVAMARRCYWVISSDLASYYGKWAVLVVARVTGTTDVIDMEVHCFDGVEAEQGGDVERTISKTTWTLHDGWEVFSFRIGEHDNDLFGAANEWRVDLYAGTNGTTDDLYIAGAYLVPLDEAYLALSGAQQLAAVTPDLYIKQLDGDRCVTAYVGTTDRYTVNLKAVGTYPLLKPKVENWLYFVMTDWSGLAVDQVDITDTFHASVQYRPRGIFLRGSNP